MQSPESARDSKKAQLQLQETRNLGDNITVPEIHRGLDIVREDRRSSRIGSKIMRCKLRLRILRASLVVLFPDLAKDVLSRLTAKPHIL